MHRSLIHRRTLSAAGGTFRRLVTPCRIFVVGVSIPIVAFRVDAFFRPSGFLLAGQSNLWVPLLVFLGLFLSVVSPLMSAKSIEQRIFLAIGAFLAYLLALVLAVLVSGGPSPS